MGKDRNPPKSPTQEVSLSKQSQPRPANFVYGSASPARSVGPDKTPGDHAPTWRPSDYSPQEVEKPPSQQYYVPHPGNYDTLAEHKISSNAIDLGHENLGYDRSPPKLPTQEVSLSKQSQPRPANFVYESASPARSVGPNKTPGDHDPTWRPSDHSPQEVEKPPSQQ